MGHRVIRWTAHGSIRSCFPAEAGTCSEGNCSTTEVRHCSAIHSKRKVHTSESIGQVNSIHDSSLRRCTRQWGPPVTVMDTETGKYRKRGGARLFQGGGTDTARTINTSCTPLHVANDWCVLIKLNYCKLIIW